MQGVRSTSAQEPTTFWSTRLDLTPTTSSLTRTSSPLAQGWRNITHLPSTSSGLPGLLRYTHSYTHRPCSTYVYLILNNKYKAYILHSFSFKTGLFVCILRNIVCAPAGDLAGSQSERRFVQLVLFLPGNGSHKGSHA